MATSSTVLGSLPAGMWYYSFMFGDAKPLVGGYVAEGRLPAPSSLVIGIGVGVVLSAIRALLDFALFKPLARKILGLPKPQKKQSLVPVPALDTLLSSSNSKILSPEDVTRGSVLTGLPEEGIREYVQMKRVVALQERQMGKFEEAAWRLVLYVALVVYGLKASFGEHWFKDPYLVWEDWPAQGHLESLENYYHCALGVYWHLIIFHFWDTRRSDFTQMLVHHVATLFLLTYSWLMSLVRIGTLIMLCHDVSDVFLELAKLFNYSQKRHRWCHLAADLVFFVFATVFGVSRLYIFPKYMVLSVWQTTVLSETSRLFFCGLLSTLLVLHVFWFSLILRMVYMFLFHGVEEDIRSENDEDDDDVTANGHNKAVEIGNGKKKQKKAQ